MADEQKPTPPSNQLQATQLLSQIPFGAVIGGVLSAAVEAQAGAATACVDFIKKVAIDDKGDLRTLHFKFEKHTGDQAQTVEISVPVMTLMPIPFIRIESLTLNFKVAIAATTDTSQSKTDSTTLGGQLDVGGGFGPFKASLAGNLSSKKDSTATSTSKYSVEHTIDVSVHAVQDDMPQGVAKLLSILNDSIRLLPAAAATAPAQTTTTPPPAQP